MNWLINLHIFVITLALIMVGYFYFFSNYGKYILQRHAYLTILFWSGLLCTFGWLTLINYNYQFNNSNTYIFGRKLYGTESVAVFLPQLMNYFSWRYIKNIPEKTNYEKDFVFRMKKQNPESAFKFMFVIIAIFVFISLYQTIDNRCFACNIG